MSNPNPNAHDDVLLEKRPDGIAILTLNRPQALNAISRAMVGALRAAVRRIETDPDIGLTIVTSAGDKAFCVGVDLKERQALSDAEAAAFRSQELFPMYKELEEKQKPAIAAVHGYCLGGGFELAMTCDMILATEAARFGLTEVKWGLIPAAGGCQRLPRIIGPFRAKELILTGRQITAREAEQLGLINRVVQRERLLDEAIALAQAVLANVQSAVRGAKKCVDHGLALRQGLAYDIEVSNATYFSPDRKAGIAAFSQRK